MPKKKNVKDMKQYHIKSVKVITPIIVDRKLVFNPVIRLIDN